MAKSVNSSPRRRLYRAWTIVGLAVIAAVFVLAAYDTWDDTKPTTQTYIVCAVVGTPAQGTTTYHLVVADREMQVRDLDLAANEVTARAFAQGLEAGKTYDFTFRHRNEMWGSNLDVEAINPKTIQYPLGVCGVKAT